MSLNIELSKDGYKVLKVHINGKERYLGSKYNQKREIDKFVSTFGEFTEKDNYIVLGLSFGEHIKELLKITNSASKILVVEFDRELVEYCLNDNEISKTLNDSRVILYKEEKDLDEFLEKYINEGNFDNLKAVVYCKYDEVYSGKTNEIYKAMKDRLVKIKLSKNTGINFGNIFFENFMLNLKYICESNPVNILKNKYKNKPAIIVSAGPSLSKNINQLKGVDNALILSGGRTLRPLLKNGIYPHYLGVVDTGEVSYKLLEDYLDKVECPLIFTDQTNNKILENYKGNKFFCSQNEFFNDIWNEKLESLYGGGSIAHTLTNLSVYMGCNPIIFIGQDLAYTGERGHDVSAGNKWNEWTFDMYKRNDDMYVKDIYGNAVRTSLQLNNYRSDLEEIIRKNANIEFINATEGGANIEGTKIKTLKEAIINLDEEKINILENEFVDDDTADKIIQKLKNNLNAFDSYIIWCNKADSLLNNLKLNYKLGKYNLVDKYINELSLLENKIKNDLDKIEILENAFSKTILTIENNKEFIIKMSDDKDTIFNKNINKSKGLYLGIKNIIESHYEKVEEKIMKLGEKYNE